MRRAVCKKTSETKGYLTMVVPATHSSEAKILNRLLHALPAGSFELETFTQLTRIVTTHDVPTAAVDCQFRPQLMLNPDFVAQYCQRDEHLFLLVMHELWHVTLAHTSLYPRVTKAHNIAFDAIINAGLMREFQGAMYQGFFDRINPADKFPHLLLRPPVGWPHNPQYPTNIGPAGTERILRQLYPPQGVRRRTMPLYQEILDLIRRDDEANGRKAMPVLVGDHSADSESRYKKKQLRDAMTRIVKRWPRLPMQFGPPGLGGRANGWQVDPNHTSEQTRRAFANVLRRAMGRSLGQYRRKERQTLVTPTAKGVLPNGADRMIHAKRGLGMPTTIWTNDAETRARIPERRVTAHIYLDVSGSMSRILPYLLTLILPYVARGQARVFQFSTQVTHLPLHELRRSLVMSTGGTSIECVTEHMLEHRQQLQRVLILTDGYTGAPSSQHTSTIKSQKMSVHLVLASESNYSQDLQDLATHIHVLPPLGRVS
jgi:hypothetical protein